MESQLLEPIAPEAIGKTLFLRLPTEEEAKSIWRLFVQPHTARRLNLEKPPVIPTALEHLMRLEAVRDMAGAQALIDRALTALNHPPRTTPVRLRKQAFPIDLFFSICRRADHAFVGMLMVQVSILHRRGEVRTLILPKFRARGIGKEAKAILLAWAFDVIGLHKMCSDLVADNDATIAINTALGFTVEGVAREHVAIEGKRLPLVHMAILKHEYDARK